MKNIDKYPNLADALEAYVAHRETEGLPFELWLELEYVEPREPTLLEAVEAVVDNRWRMSDFTNKLDDLIKAIEREKRKPVRNLDVYKTAKEADKAYEHMCFGKKCDSCNYGHGKTKVNCSIAWLYAEADAAGKEAK